QLIATYLERHAEIHHSLGIFGDFLNKRTEELKLRLSNIESDLRTAKKKAGIISLEDSKRYDSEQIAKLEQDIRDVDAQLAERQAEAGAIARLLPGNPSPAAGLPLASNLPAVTNLASVPSALPETNLAAITQLAPVPPEKLDEYKRISDLLETLRKKDQALSLEFTPESYKVKNVRAQIAANETAKRKLENENPGLLAEKGAGLGSDQKPASTSESNARATLVAETIKLISLQARLVVLTNQLAFIRREAASVAEAEGPITQLERQRLLEEGDYSYFQRNLEQLRADEELGANAGRNYSNIMTIQSPSPPFRDPFKLLKVAMMVLFGSLAVAFGLAFVLEFYLDPTFKRTTEVERRLGLPMFISIPCLQLNGKASGLALEAPRVPLLAETNEAAEGSRNPEAASPDPALDAPRPGLHAPSSTAPWDPRHQLRPFHDALRDRLTTYFDLKNLTHKPKLVALTSCGEGSGVTTIAAGLAASLSETGEGNVLLVDMNEQGSAHQFYRGKPACGLEDALELQTRDTALVQDKLYVVRENHNGDRLPRSMPKRFQHLVPKLKASDFDYIIFDLPPISQVSVTSKLARYMDISLVVVEAEQTDREVVKRASSFLAQSGANLGVVLNKTRAYGPKRLQQEL
ncbi:MAG TPA: hypothetical protein VN829_23885, partial [Dongiaceae bacterium]|nr:hypothetical protein [Dongiaceae bacterium]